MRRNASPGFLLGMLAAMLLVASCGSDDGGSRDDAGGSRQGRSTTSTGAGGGLELAETAFDTVAEFADVADTIAVVTVAGTEPEPEQEDYGDERSRLHLVTLQVDEPIKGDLSAGQQVTISDGLYTQIRDSETGEWGPEELEIVTPGVVLDIDDRAVVGIRNGEILSDGVFPVSGDAMADTDRDEELYTSVEEMSLQEFIDELRGAISP